MSREIGCVQQCFTTRDRWRGAMSEDVAQPCARFAELTVGAPERSHCARHLQRSLRPHLHIPREHLRECVWRGWRINNHRGLHACRALTGDGDAKVARVLAARPCSKLNQNAGFGGAVRQPQCWDEQRCDGSDIRFAPAIFEIRDVFTTVAHAQPQFVLRQPRPLSECLQRRSERRIAMWLPHMSH